jgi:single-stranded-DNA-specific exonuclease
MPMKWVEPQTILPSNEIREAFHKSLLLAEQLAKREITTITQAKQFINLNSYDQASPFAFPEMEKVVERIQKAIKNKECIGIWGDFDVDGQTSTAILVDGLRKSGADVAFHIPVRGKESHGIQLVSLRNFLSENNPRLFITCDTGISEFESMDFLSSNEIDTIISDHHTPAEKLPPVYAIINPRLLSDRHPLYPLAGVGTAFQLIRALFTFQEKEVLNESFYDLVALGTIADLAELTSENRFYTKSGLKTMNAKPRKAIREMERLSGINNTILNESHIGFMLAPRLNAVGRLDDSNPIVNFLLSEDEKEIIGMANKLEQLNVQRKLTVDMVYKSAVDILEKKKELLQYPVIVIERENWEKGVVGIAASRLVDKYNKPAILLDRQGGIAAGSARSVIGIDIIKAIQQNSQYLIKYGGHPMAAGLSIEVVNIPEFREGLSTSILKMGGGKQLERKLEVDSYLPLANISDSLLNEIDQLAPFGQGNPAPVLVSRNLEIEESSFIGKSHEHRKIIIKDQQGNSKNVIWWGSADSSLPNGQFDLAYNLRRDNFQSDKDVLLEWLDFRETEESIELHSEKHRFIIHDYRSVLNQKDILNKLIRKPDVLFWPKEVKHEQNLDSRNEEIVKKKILAILLPPPDRETLITVVEKADPTEIYLFNSSSIDDSFETFVKKILGIVKYCLSNKDGKSNLKDLGAVLCQNQKTVLLGLKFLDAKGMIEFDLQGINVQIRQVKKPESVEMNNIQANLKKTLDETSSFRSYYLRANPDNFFFGT